MEGCGGVVGIRAPRAGKVVPGGVDLRPLVEGCRRIGGVEDLYAVAEAGGVDDAPCVVTDAEGMSLYHHSPLAADEFKEGGQVKAHNIIVGNEPFLGKAVDKVIRGAVPVLDAEEHIKAYLISPLLGVLIAPAVALHPLVPGEGAVNAGVAVEEVVGDDDARVALRLVLVRHFRPCGGGAGAGLGCVHMCFVSEHDPFPLS